MKYRPLFVLGTSSGAGKSLITMALLRIFSDMGIDAIPFKVQNMSLNAVSIPGGEIAFAQYLQAKAARVKPEICMNPILLKPEENSTHIILKGKYYATKNAREYFTHKTEFFFNEAKECYETLSRSHELVLIEGAGSPSEINLQNDISNLKFANEIGAKNILVADIERGGVFASIVGTFCLSDMKENIGVIINKFSGDEVILEPGYNFLKNRFNIKVIGTVPKVKHNIPEEDSLSEWHRRNGKVNVGIVWMPHMSNLTDFEPLEFQPDLGFDFLMEPNQIDWADVIIIPGSKLTVPDLLYLKEKGFDSKLNEIKGKKWIIGLCGGFQILGKSIDDQVESGSGKVEGLGILDAETKMEGTKVTVTTEAILKFPGLDGIKVRGYEIHIGKSVSNNSFSIITKEDDEEIYKPDGAVDDKSFGTYIHGLFDNYEFTRRLFNLVAEEKGTRVNINEFSIDKEIDKFSNVIKGSVDIDYILRSLKP